MCRRLRVLAATHRDLAREAAEECFRQDLLYRIRVARVRLPALRERREDLPLRVRAFLADHCASTGKRIDGISDEATFADNRGDLVAKFAVADVRGIVEPGMAQLTLRGTTRFGDTFSGTDTVRVISVEAKK